MGILQARILEWVAIPFPRGSSQPRDWTQVSPITGGFFTIWASREAQEYWSGYPFSRRSSWPRNWSWVSCIAGRFFTSLPPREAPGDVVRWGKDLESITRETESLALAGRFSASEPPGEARWFLPTGNSTAPIPPATFVFPKNSLVCVPFLPPTVWHFGG